MAAILPFLENPDDEVEDRKARESAPSLGALAGLGDAYGEESLKERARMAFETFQQSHAGLTRFYWNRLLVEKELRRVKVWLVRTKHGFAFRIDPPLPRDTKPWKLTSKASVRTNEEGLVGTVQFDLLAESNSKMRCTSFDLPSGPPQTGGSCVGAVAAQSIVPPGERGVEGGGKYLPVPPPGLAPDTQFPYREAETICSFCYAAEGSYDYTEIQAAEIVRFWWTARLLTTREGTDEWVRIMTAAVLAASTPTFKDSGPGEPQKRGLRTGRTIRPFRLHSSGDFFSHEYAAAWVAVANAVWNVDSQIVFWAPTRSWASRGWVNAWPKILSKLDHDNLVVRPSAFHIGDPAPEALMPGQARGTTSLVAPVGIGKGGKMKAPGVFVRSFPQAIAHDGDGKRDYDCPVYAMRKADEKGSCQAANCRVCWVRPDVRVNYSLH